MKRVRNSNKCVHKRLKKEKCTANKSRGEIKWNYKKHVINLKGKKNWEKEQKTNEVNGK